MSDWFTLAVATALIWGFVPFFERRAMTGLEPTEAVFVRCLGVGVGALVPLAIRPGLFAGLRRAGWEPVLWLLGGALLGSVVAQFANLGAMRHGEISRISPITGSWPLVTFLVGVLVLGEPLTWTKALGMALILGGIVLMRL